MDRQGAAPPDGTGVPGLLADLRRLTEGRQTVTLAALLDCLGARGHGPLLLTLAILMMLPTGMLPLMPALTGLLIAATAVQMLAGGKGVSLPARLRRVEIGAGALRAGLARAEPSFHRLGRVLHPRAPALVQGPLSLAAIAAILLVSAAAMILIGAIPGVPFLLCVPALLFGLGLTTGDGLVVGLGFVASLGAGLGVWHLAPRLAALWPL